MEEYVANRAIEVARYVIATKCTVRDAAKAFGVSKTTIYADLTRRLPIIHPSLYKQVKKVLDHNLSIRHVRGGEGNKIRCQEINKELFYKNSTL